MTAVLARISLPLIALITASAAVVSTGGLVAEGRQARSTPPPARDAEPRVIPLWDGPAPGALGTEDVDQPTLTYYPPAARQAGTTAVIIAPGGSYVRLSMNHEGRQVASLLNAMGVSAFVLKYRLGPRYRHPVPVGDARRAVRLVRAMATDFVIRPDRVGMMGFSAGGHLTATAGTRFDAGNPDAADAIERVSSRPDFLILGYPVISFRAPLGHAGSIRNLVGDDPPVAVIDELSNERHVTATTPPTFLFHTSADTGVPALNSIEFYAALMRAGVPAELHVFETGPHGVGLALNDARLSAWPVLLGSWLRGRGLVGGRVP